MGESIRKSLSNRCVLTINGGSSSIKFAAFAVDEPPRPLFSGVVERIGQPEAALVANSADRQPLDRQPLNAADHEQAALRLANWIAEHVETSQLAGIGHRVVHGGVRLFEHQRITPTVVAELREAVPLDLAHLPREIELIDTFAKAFP